MSQMTCFEVGAFCCCQMTSVKRSEEATVAVAVAGWTQWVGQAASDDTDCWGSSFVFSNPRCARKRLGCQALTYERKSCLHLWLWNRICGIETAVGGAGACAAGHPAHRNNVFFQTNK